MLARQDPHPLSCTSVRLRNVVGDPYCQAQYLLYRYGRLKAFQALFARPRLASPDFIDTLHSSGAYVSRYLGQMVARAFVGNLSIPGVRKSWARSPGLSSVPHLSLLSASFSELTASDRLKNFAHFMSLVARLHPDFTCAKKQDDNTIVSNWLCSSMSRRPDFKRPSFNPAALQGVRDAFEHGYMPWTDGYS